MTPLSREGIARRIARALPSRSYVNLGIGMPGLVSHHTRPEQDIVLQSENGVLHYRGVMEGERPQLDCIDASKRPVAIRRGGCYTDVVTSFGIMRGGHLDVAVLGAFEVSAGGDLANWSTGHADDVPGIGGAMDLACGARAIWVMMEHQTRDARPKVVETCSYPLTARNVVSRIFTDLAVLEVTPAGLVVLDIVEGLDRAELQARTGAALSFAGMVATMRGSGEASTATGAEMDRHTSFPGAG